MSRKGNEGGAGRSLADEDRTMLFPRNETPKRGGPRPSTQEDRTMIPARSETPKRGAARLATQEDRAMKPARSETPTRNFKAGVLVDDVGPRTESPFRSERILRQQSFAEAPKPRQYHDGVNVVEVLSLDQNSCSGECLSPLQKMPRLLTRVDCVERRLKSVEGCIEMLLAWLTQSQIGIGLRKETKDTKSMRQILKEITDILASEEPSNEAGDNAHGSRRQRSRDPRIKPCDAMGRRSMSEMGISSGLSRCDGEDSRMNNSTLPPLDDGSHGGRRSPPMRPPLRQSLTQQTMQEPGKLRASQQDSSKTPASPLRAKPPIPSDHKPPTPSDFPKAHVADIGKLDSPMQDPITPHASSDMSKAPIPSHYKSPKSNPSKIGCPRPLCLCSVLNPTLSCTGACERAERMRKLIQKELGVPDEAPLDLTDLHRLATLANDRGDDNELERTLDPRVSFDEDKGLITFSPEIQFVARYYGATHKDDATAEFERPEAVMRCMKDVAEIFKRFGTRITADVVYRPTGRPTTAFPVEHKSWLKALEASRAELLLNALVQAGVSRERLRHSVGSYCEDGPSSSIVFNFDEK